MYSWVKYKFDQEIIGGLMDVTMGVIIPCYNEAEVIQETAKRLTGFFDELINDKKISDTSFIKFVDDGSTDNTWMEIEHLCTSNKYIHGLKLSRNFGHQNALAAGMLNNSKEYDCLVSMDADLQDDYLVIEDFIEEFQNGSEIVYGVRSSRKSDSFFKRLSARFFYRLMMLLGGQIVNNHADFRLVSKRAVEDLKSFNEVNLFLRGIFPLIGYNTAKVFYSRPERYAGKSKYSIRKMLSFSFDGITSFSIRPLRFITMLGFLISIISMIYAVWIIAALLQDQTIPGWTSTVLPIVLLGGIQIFAIGLIGEYVGKAYIEIKSRPRYIIDRMLD